MKIKKISGAILFLVYFGSRLWNLTGLPIFYDEANYLNWGWIGVHGQPFYSLFDAKQPGLLWLFGLFEVIFSDQLLAGRLVAVIFGAINVFLICKLAEKLVPGEGHRAGWLYIVTPLLGFFDRQALMETALVTISMLAIWQIIEIWEKGLIKNAIYLGIILATGIWIKSSALMLLAACGGVFIFMILTKKNEGVKYANLLIYTLVSMAIVASPLVFQPMFLATWGRNSAYSLTLAQILTLPVKTWLLNLGANAEIWWLTLTPVICLAGIWGGVRIFLDKKWKPQWSLVGLWLLLPVTGMMVSAKFSGELFMRYGVPYIWPVLLFTTYIYARYKTAFTATLVLPGAMLLLLIINPVNYFSLMAKFSKYSYQDHYVMAEDSGFAVDSVLSYLNSKSGVVALPLTIGNINPGLFTYTHKSSRLVSYYVDMYMFEGNPKPPKCLAFPASVKLVETIPMPESYKRFWQEEKTIADHNWSYKVYSLKTGCQPHETQAIELLPSNLEINPQN